jgi:formylglycine-generating enzyme required for sulfatase activity
MKRFVTSLILLLSLTFSSALRAKASSQWMWHGAFPWVYSHAENSWWYMKAGTDGKFLAWKQGDEKWYSFDEASQTWVVLPGQENVQEEQQDPSANRAGDTYTVPDLSLEMIWVDPGTFTMGSPTSEAGRKSNETQHEVTLTNGFWLGKYEVTKDQWGLMYPGFFLDGGDNSPADMGSWNSAANFCEKLTERESEAGRLPAGMAYQLPTEAQWEYACRAGSTTVFYWGDIASPEQGNILEDYPYTRAWFDPIPAYLNPNPKSPHPVGQYAANPWGFYDMHGNVWEWTADWYGDYPSGAVTDPEGPAVGSARVLRGGAFNYYAVNARSAYRKAAEPAGSGFGFRLSLRPASK